jgi:hypothetical protein
MEGKHVVTSDDQKLGTVIAERDDCVIIETGHVFKSKHAIPRSFLHEHDGVLRATVTKDVVDDSPKIDLDHWSCEVVRLHYGLDGPFEVDPDPNDGAYRPDDGVHQLSDEQNDLPAVHERQANAADPSGTTANLD